MISIKDWMELVNYRVTEGSDYGWQCYGPNAHMLDSWNGLQDGHSFTIIFDLDNQTVYEVQAHDYLHQRAYRIINPQFLSNTNDEAQNRNIDKDQAWDDVDYQDLELDVDFVQRAQDIISGDDHAAS